MIEIPRTAKARALILERCETDAKYRKAVLDQCSLPGSDACIFFINTFVWSLDPRPDSPSPEMPFLLFEFQEELIRRIDAAIAGLDDLWIEKSRDMGLTWTVCAKALHDWVFRAGQHILLGSNGEDLVDNRTPDSHFGKLDFILDRLPPWFMREALPGFSARKHRHKMKLVNASKAFSGVYGNTILGDSANPNFGRGTRKTWVYVDEGATFAEFPVAWMALAQVARTRITGSTPFGMNAWGKMIHMPENQHRRITLHWRLSPMHDDEWYERECRRIVIPQHIAQELDLDYRHSGGGLVYPTWADCKFGVYDYDPKQTLYVSWDAGLDMTSLIWWQREPKSGVVTMLDCYETKNKAISWFLPFVLGTGTLDPSHLRQYTRDEIVRIMVHDEWGQAFHYGDPSLRQRDVGSGESPADVLRANGLYIHVAPTNDFIPRRRAVLEGLAGLQVNLPGPDSPIGCEAVDEAIRNARLQNRSEDSQATSEPSPIHDATSHFRSSMEYFFLCLPRLAGLKRPEPYRHVAAYESLTKPRNKLTTRLLRRTRAA